MSRTPNSGIDYVSRDYEGIREAMLSSLSLKMPEYTDHRQTDAGIVILELLAQGLDIVNYYLDVVANEIFLPTEEQRANVLKWCNILGYIPKSTTPAKFKQVFVLTAVQATDTVIPSGTVVKTTQTASEASVYFETESDLIIPAGKLGNEVDESGDYLYTVNVVQGVTIYNELVGSSIGTSDQQFKLKYTHALLDSLTVRVNEGSGFTTWTRVNTFTDSAALSKHFVATLNDNDETVISFGNNVFGKVPSAFTNGIYCTYRIGGGTSGNVAAEKINQFEQTIAKVSYTFNPEVAYEFGEDKETMAEIKRNAPLALKTQWGALALEDFSSVILSNFTEVKYASAKVNETDVDDIDIYLLMKTQGTFANCKTLIDTFFDPNSGGRKIVGVDAVNIIEGTLVPLTITSNLIVSPTFSRAEVSAEIQEYVSDYFAYGNRDFDTDLSFSDLTSLIMYESGIQGIKSFKITTPSEEVLSPARGVIYSLNSLMITANGGVA